MHSAQSPAQLPWARDPGQRWPQQSVRFAEPRAKGPQGLAEARCGARLNRHKCAAAGLPIGLRYRHDTQCELAATLQTDRILAWEEVIIVAVIDPVSGQTGTSATAMRSPDCFGKTSY